MNPKKLAAESKNLINELMNLNLSLRSDATSAEIEAYISRIENFVHYVHDFFAKHAALLENPSKLESVVDSISEIFFNRSLLDFNETAEKLFIINKLLENKVVFNNLIRNKDLTKRWNNSSYLSYRTSFGFLVAHVNKALPLDLTTQLQTNAELKAKEITSIYYPVKLLELGIAIKLQPNSIPPAEDFGFFNHAQLQSSLETTIHAIAKIRASDGNKNPDKYLLNRIEAAIRHIAKTRPEWFPQVKDIDAWFDDASTKNNYQNYSIAVVKNYSQNFQRTYAMVTVQPLKRAISKIAENSPEDQQFRLALTRLHNNLATLLPAASTQYTFSNASNKDTEEVDFTKQENNWRIVGQIARAHETMVDVYTSPTASFEEKRKAVVDCYKASRSIMVNNPRLVAELPNKAETNDLLWTVAKCAFWGLIGFTVGFVIGGPIVAAVVSLVFLGLAVESAYSSYNTAQEEKTSQKISQIADSINNTTEVAIKATDGNRLEVAEKNNWSIRIMLINMVKSIVREPKAAKTIVNIKNDAVATKPEPTPTVAASITSSSTTAILRLVAKDHPLKANETTMDGEVTSDLADQFQDGMVDGASSSGSSKQSSPIGTPRRSDSPPPGDYLETNTSVVNKITSASRETEYLAALDTSFNP